MVRTAFVQVRPILREFFNLHFPEFLREVGPGIELGEVGRPARSQTQLSLGIAKEVQSTPRDQSRTQMGKEATAFLGGGELDKDGNDMVIPSPLRPGFPATEAALDDYAPTTIQSPRLAVGFGRDVERINVQAQAGEPCTMPTRAIGDDQGFLARMEAVTLANEKSVGLLPKERRRRRILAIPAAGGVHGFAHAT